MIALLILLFGSVVIFCLLLLIDYVIIRNRIPNKKEQLMILNALEGAKNLGLKNGLINKNISVLKSNSPLSKYSVAIYEDNVFYYFRIFRFSEIHSKIEDIFEKEFTQEYIES
jgi:hypothetical protein